MPEHVTFEEDDPVQQFRSPGDSGDRKAPGLVRFLMRLGIKKEMTAYIILYCVVGASFIVAGYIFFEVYLKKPKTVLSPRSMIEHVYDETQ